MPKVQLRVSEIHKNPGIESLGPINRKKVKKKWVKGLRVAWRLAPQAKSKSMIN